MKRPSVVARRTNTIAREEEEATRFEKSMRGEEELREESFAVATPTHHTSSIPSPTRHNQTPQQQPSPPTLQIPENLESRLSNIKTSITTLNLRMDKLEKSMHLKLDTLISLFESNRAQSLSPSPPIPHYRTPSLVRTSHSSPSQPSFHPQPFIHSPPPASPTSPSHCLTIIPYHPPCLPKSLQYSPHPIPLKSHYTNSSLESNIPLSRLPYLWSKQPSQPPPPPPPKPSTTVTSSSPIAPIQEQPSQPPPPPQSKPSTTITSPSLIALIQTPTIQPSTLPKLTPSAPRKPPKKIKMTSKDVQA